MLDTAVFYSRQHEHRRVVTLLRAFEFAPKSISEILANLLEANRHDDRLLTFRDLDTPESLDILGMEEVCPVCIVARSGSSNVMNLPLSSLWNGLGRSWIGRVWEEESAVSEIVREAGFYGNQDARPLAVVLNFAAERGGVVLHGADLPASKSRAVMHFRLGGKEGPTLLTLESFPEFARRLVLAWRGEQAIREMKRDPISPRLAAWMVERLGSGPATIVLAWLWGAWHDQEKRWMTVRDGQSCLMVNRTTIAHYSGLSLDAIKKGLEKLRIQGLIATTRGDRRLYVRLIPPT